MLPVVCCATLRYSVNLKKHAFMCLVGIGSTGATGTLTSKQFSVSLGLLVSALMKLVSACMDSSFTVLRFKPDIGSCVICGREMLCGLCRNGSNCFLCVQATVFHFPFLCGEGQKRERECLLHPSETLPKSALKRGS